MTLPTRLVASLGICAGLLLTGCSGDSPETQPSAPDSSASASVPADDPAAATGGTCDATLGDASAPDPAADPDEAASKEALAAVSLSDDAAAAPTVSFDAPLQVSSEVIHVSDEGSGDQIADGQLITFNFLVCDMVTGEKMHSTWGTTPDADDPITQVLSVNNFGESLAASLTSAKVGSRLLWGQPGVSAEESYTGEAMNGYLYVLSVQDSQTLPDAASGTDVTPTDASLPAISITDGKPAVSVPDSFTDPAELVVQPLIEGDGAAVEAGQTVVVKYTGWLTDGTQFDSSWDREAPEDVLMFDAGTGGVIQGWDQGIVGQKVGSRVLLVVPSDLGYGEAGGGEKIPANATLVFVVDILAAF
ncbi:MAG TPA: FKBP-type peptidyl-prolyl cis-trans isomerase [Arachnia sp.]|nr:FKBP-type peptidyl-prolyl cis-trans isomerase [Arachnia sp.]